MNLDNLKREGELWGRMQALVQLDSLTETQQTEYRNMEQEYDTLHAQNKAELEEQAIEDRREEKRALVRTVTHASEDQQADLYDRWKLAFRNFMRFGERGLTRRDVEVCHQVQDIYKGIDDFFDQNNMELRQQGIGTGSAGGFTTHPEFSFELEEMLKMYAASRQVARIVRTATGSNLLWPTLDETAVVGRIIDEHAAEQKTDMTFGQQTIRAFVYTSDYVSLSRELLQDTLINMVDVVQRALANRIGRAFAVHTTTGAADSTTTPEGMVSAAPTVTAAGATAITFDDLLELLHSVDPAYRQVPTIGTPVLGTGEGTVAWMMHDQILKEVRKLKDQQNRPLWEPSLQAGVPDRIYGYPVVYNQNMQSTIATATRTVLFGNFSRYIIRDVAGMEISRLNEIHALNRQVTWLGFARMDGRALKASATELSWKALLQA